MGWKKAEYGFHVEEIDENCGTLTNPHHFLTMYTWDVLNVNANRMKQLLNNKKMLESRISAGATENYRDGKNLTHKQ